MKVFLRKKIICKTLFTITRSILDNSSYYAIRINRTMKSNMNEIVISIALANNAEVIYISFLILSIHKRTTIFTLCNTRCLVFIAGNRTHTCDSLRLIMIFYMYAIAIDSNLLHYMKITA